MKHPRPPHSNFSSTPASGLALALAVFAALLCPRPAAAQTDPKFEFAKPEVAKTVEWRSQVKAGGVMTTGNSQAKSGTIAATLSRKEGSNRAAIEGGVAYGTTNVVTPVVDTTAPAMPLITAIDRQSLTTMNNWFVKGRDDHFLTANNSAYISAQGAGDKIAGKTFYGGGQIGYSRQVLKNEKNLLVAEIGYDFSYERYVQQPNTTIDPVAVHSARVLVGETLTLTAATGITASVEALFNLNKEGKALDSETGKQGVSALHDTRVIGRAGLTTTIWKSLSIAFGFTLKYDQNPAPFPIPKNAPAGSAWSPTAFAGTGGLPFSDKVDTLTEASLIYTFL